MDATSVALCRSNKIPILVFNMQLLGQGKILELLKTRDHGTLIRSSI
jgi:uridylate kinase